MINDGATKTRKTRKKAKCGILALMRLPMSLKQLGGLMAFAFVLSHCLLSCFSCRLEAPALGLPG